jgi:hypothetical protein
MATEDLSKYPKIKQNFNYNKQRKTKWTNQDKKLNIVLFRNNETIVHLLKGNIGEIFFCTLEHFLTFKQCELSMAKLKG